VVEKSRESGYVELTKSGYCGDPLDRPPFQRATQTCSTAKGCARRGGSIISGIDLIGGNRAAVICILLALPFAFSASAAQQPRLAGSTDATPAAPLDRQSTRQHDDQHDFDFEFGRWSAHLRRLAHPLTGDQSWIEYQGISVVRKVWNGRANLGELTVAGAHGRIEGLSLRIYDPQRKQWQIYWANAAGGGIGVPTVGRFGAGRGEFYDREAYDGRSIVVRIVISGITRDDFHLEQAFSPDDGKSWETNWIASFTRLSP
jgi:hypothetical protein